LVFVQIPGVLTEQVFSDEVDNLGPGWSVGRHVGPWMAISWDPARPAGFFPTAYVELLPAETDLNQLASDEQAKLDAEKEEKDAMRKAEETTRVVAEAEAQKKVEEARAAQVTAEAAEVETKRHAEAIRIAEEEAEVERAWVAMEKEEAEATRILQEEAARIACTTAAEEEAKSAAAHAVLLQEQEQAQGEEEARLAAQTEANRVKAVADEVAVAHTAAEAAAAHAQEEEEEEEKARLATQAEAVRVKAVADEVAAAQAAAEAEDAAEAAAEAEAARLHAAEAQAVARAAAVAAEHAYNQVQAAQADFLRLVRFHLYRGFRSIYRGNIRLATPAQRFNWVEVRVVCAMMGAKFDINLPQYLPANLTGWRWHCCQRESPGETDARVRVVAAEKRATVAEDARVLEAAVAMALTPRPSRRPTAPASRKNWRPKYLQTALDLWPWEMGGAHPAIQAAAAMRDADKTSRAAIAGETSACCTVASSTSAWARYRCMHTVAVPA
jgi:chemotaxis protein histidine kinase CheA